MVYFRCINKKIFLLLKRYFYVILTFVLCFLIYTEVISYLINKKDWIHLQCTYPKQCLKVLLVADPQITGNEQIKILTRLAQYDSDSYIQKTYIHAFNFVKPNITIFLGDLMDEGSTTTNEKYNEYLKRLNNIFPQSESTKIWLPGDNDIGGEGFDRVTSAKVKRYKTAFNQPETLHFNGVTFLKINQMMHSYPKVEQRRDFYNTSQIFVILSHVPLLFRPNFFSEKVLSKAQPHIIFAAHEHKAMIVSTDGLLREDRQIVPLMRGDNKVYKFNLGSSDLYEILVPTCSYRMGTTSVGFGFAIIEKDEVQYTVLWSPSRFQQLWSYILMILLILIGFICFILF
ncbi:hypothetical protein WA026_021710 [Henosepilachna vigintioctopunctata]|uniref:Calcineurin-like phosphoesterase domain-containing protein n=1 Tax=Henosepilachna vigintioctopunctata TaxID=420089 RepID=A0AAW1UCS0_9CUCU